MAILNAGKSDKSEILSNSKGFAKLHEAVCVVKVGDILEAGVIFRGLCDEKIVWVVEKIDITDVTRRLRLSASYMGINLGEGYVDLSPHKAVFRMEASGD